LKDFKKNIHGHSGGGRSIMTKTATQIKYVAGELPKVLAGEA